MGVRGREVGWGEENGTSTHGRWKKVRMPRVLGPGGERELLLCTRQTLSLLSSVQTFDSIPADGLWKLFLCGITI